MQANNKISKNDITINRHSLFSTVYLIQTQFINSYLAFQIIRIMIPWKQSLWSSTIELDTYRLYAAYKQTI